MCATPHSRPAFEPPEIGARLGRIAGAFADNHGAQPDFPGARPDFSSASGDYFGAPPIGDSDRLEVIFRAERNLGHPRRFNWHSDTSTNLDVMTNRVEETISLLP